LADRNELGTLTDWRGKRMAKRTDETRLDPTEATEAKNVA